MSASEEQMHEAVRNQWAHMAASHAVDRRGWTPQQWIDDARRLMGDLDGSVLDLVNGHVLRMLRMLDALVEKDAELERLRTSERQARSVIALHQQNGCGVQLDNEGLRINERRLIADRIAQRFEGHPDINDIKRVCNEIGGSA